MEKNFYGLHFQSRYISIGGRSRPEEHLDPLESTKNQITYRIASKY